VMQADTILILPASPNAFSQQETAILVREMFLLESPLSFGMNELEVNDTV